MQFFVGIENGARKLYRAITSFTGNQNEIVATNSDGKLDFSLLPPITANDLSDVSISIPPPPIGSILRWDGINWVPSSDRLSWNWTASAARIDKKMGVLERGSGVASTDARFHCPVIAKLFLAVSSSTDNDDWQISIYVNGEEVVTLLHPENTSSFTHNPDLQLYPGDELYVMATTVGKGDIDNACVEMFLQEI